MALFITKEGLKNNAGGQELPSPLLVRFTSQTSRQSYDQRFRLFYSIPDNEYVFNDVQVAYDVTNTLPTYDEEGNQNGTMDVTTKAILPDQFTLTLSPEVIGQYEVAINQALPNVQSTLVKAMFGYHLMVKTHLESLLGDGTVTIDLNA